MIDKARFSAYTAVKRIFNGAFSNLILSNSDLKGLDRSFAEAITLGTIERKITLEYILEKFVEKSPEDNVKILLLTGIYQLIYMDRVPDNAACNETVKIAKAEFSKNAAGFVNAVMRSICRNKDSIISEINNSNDYIKYSVNPDLFRLIREQYPSFTDKIFGAFFNKSPLFLRINTLKTNAKEVCERFDFNFISNKCVQAENTQIALKYLDNGYYYVQGRGSQEAVNLLNAQPSDTVVDVCACPGGKTLGAAIDMNNQGNIFSFDLHKNKLPLILKSAEKLGISIIKTKQHDGRFVNERLINKADKVICDVPCSGTGIIGTKPEIRYKSPKEFEGLFPTQRAILNCASKYLKVGGTLVYSTCSINKQENEEVVKDFLDKNKNFTLICDKTYFPFEEEGEGFYTAKITREK